MPETEIDLNLIYRLFHNKYDKYNSHGLHFYGLTFYTDYSGEINSVYCEDNRFIEDDVLIFYDLQTLLEFLQKD